MRTVNERRDGRRVRGQASRQAIVEAAIDRIAARGLSNVTLDSVAERAGVSRPLVVFHFKSKDRMLIDVLVFLGERYDAGWKARLAGDGASVAQRIRDLIVYDVRFVTEHPTYVGAWLAFWGESRSNTLYRQISTPNDQDYKNDLRGLVAALVAERGYDGVDAEAVAEGLWSMMYGFWLDAHLCPAADYEPRALGAIYGYLGAVFPRDFGH